MDVKKIEKAILEIVGKKKQLSRLSYSDESYDTIEEELHNMEDDFTDKYGMYLEKALEEVHSKHCPDNDILLPIAYLANAYEPFGKSDDGSELFDVLPNQGVFVEVDKLPGKNTKLVIVPGPLRIVLLAPNYKEEVWSALEGS